MRTPASVHHQTRGLNMAWLREHTTHVYTPSMCQQVHVHGSVCGTHVGAICSEMVSSYNMQSIACSSWLTHTVSSMTLRTCLVDVLQRPFNLCLSAALLLAVLLCPVPCSRHDEKVQPNAVSATFAQRTDEWSVQECGVMQRPICISMAVSTHARHVCLYVAAAIG